MEAARGHGREGRQGVAFELSSGGHSVSDTVTSFWFFLPFTLQANGGAVLVFGDKGCYLAVLLEGEAGDELPGDPEWGAADGAVGLEIGHATDGKIRFEHLGLRRSTAVQRNGEWSELRLYGGWRPADGSKPNWVDAGGWRRAGFYSQAAEQSWRREFSFGAIDGAPLDEAVVVRNRFGSARRVTVVRRMIGGTICDQVIGAGGIGAGSGARIPALKISTALGGPKLWQPDESFLTNGNMQSRAGFAMIAAGAFAGQSADSMLEEWGDIVDVDDVGRRLARIVWAPENVALSGSRLLRKLHNVHDAQRRGDYAAAGLHADPVEVLYVGCGDAEGNVG